MADAPAKAPAKGKKGGALSGKWHGVPIPVLALGGGAASLLVYRWWKARQGAGSNTGSASSGSPNPSATTGAGSGLGAGFAGTGGGAGGGGIAGGDSSLGGNTGKKRILAGAEKQNANDLAAAQSAAASAAAGSAAYNLARGEDANGVLLSGPAAGQVASAANGWGTTAGPGATPQPSGGSVATPVAQAGSTATGAGGNPTGVAGSFNLPGGSLNFQPTAAVRQGNQVAYGIPNQGVASQAQQLKGVVESGKTLMSKGWSNLTPGALYLVR